MALPKPPIYYNDAITLIIIVISITLLIVIWKIKFLKKLSYRIVLSLLVVLLAVLAFSNFAVEHNPLYYPSEPIKDFNTEVTSKEKAVELLQIYLTEEWVQKGLTSEQIKNAFQDIQLDKTVIQKEKAFTFKIDITCYDISTDGKLYAYNFNC